MNIYEARWIAAKNNVLAVKAKCEEVGEDYLLTFGDEFIRAEQIEIREDSIVVVVDDCAYGIFTNNPLWDEGSHDKVEVINARFKHDFKIMKEIPWHRV